jgi:hypothetical protein
MVRTSLAVAVGIAAGFAIVFGLGVMVMTFANDESLADFGD